MATILLSAAGGAVGSALGGTALGLSTAVVGRAVGATLGRVIDQTLLGGGSEVIATGRLERYRLTGASEGSPVPAIFGRMRVGGQVIWSTRFREHVNTTRTGGKGIGGGASVSEFSYSVSMAVALCEGEILRVGRVWADGMEVPQDELDFRVYRGTKDQLPDPKIEAVEGTGNVPAYRGVAYVVFEELDLSRFGNRVPQFSFEVIRATDSALVPENARSLSSIIEAVAMIPATGEYALATTPVHYSSGFGWNRSANVNSSSGLTDFSTSLLHLNDELPICNSVSLVVSWFGDDLRCSECTLKPKVEQTETEGKGMAWTVNGVTRDAASTVAQMNGRAVYGGTPADGSVIEAITAIRAAGRSVLFYPFILMDQTEGNALSDPWSGSAEQPHLPWRGRITSSLAAGVEGSPDGTADAAAEVAAFFGDAALSDFTPGNGTVIYSGPEEWSYRRFILHYAHLCALAGGVEAFCIGSEMRGLTQVRGAGKTFPAVQALKRLARDVRTILGPQTKIGYGADWSEYFGYHPSDGSGDVYFHLDTLWADDSVDFIGIDNYMPLSDWRDGGDHRDREWRSIYNLDYLLSNVCGGEGYDWYYKNDSDRVSQIRSPILDEAHSEPWIFRYKDLRNWWGQRHHNRVSGVRQESPTEWTPESKPIWFTELGCAAVDKGTNQPNKFVDPKSSESSLPYFSNGRRDDYLQSQYLRAVHAYWREPANNPESSVYAGRMVDMSKAHVWAWDARPYPTFPARGDLWTDGENYLKGHWLNGRTTSESLAAVVSEICRRNGVESVDTDELHGLVRGYAISDVTSARAALQPLALAHGFDSFETEGGLRFLTRCGLVDFDLLPEALAVTEELHGEIEVSRQPWAEVAGRVRASFVGADGDFAVRCAEALFPGNDDPTVAATELPMCLTAAEGQAIVERWLSEVRIARDRIRCVLPPSMRSVTVGDTIRVPVVTGGSDLFRVDSAEIGAALEIEAVRVEQEVFSPSSESELPVPATVLAAPLPVYSVFLDLPLITGEENPIAPRIAVAANPWPGKVAVYSSPSGDGFELNSLMGARATIGVTETPLAAAAPGRVDRASPLRVHLASGALASVETEAMLNGANSMAIGNPETGDWEVFQFRRAELVAQDTYEISERLRGQAGTDGTMPATWPIGSIVILLDHAVQPIAMPSAARGLERHYLVGPAGRPYDDASYQSYVKAFHGIGLRPYAPVHLRAVRIDDGGLSVAWIRRTRVDGDGWEVFEVPLAEDSERYVVRVIREGTIVRECLTDAPEWSYSASMQDEDGMTSPCDIHVAQISDRYGAGPFRRMTIDV